MRDSSPPKDAPTIWPRSSTSSSSANASGGRLGATIVLNFVITITEIVGGILSGSLALVADALHNFTDGVALILSYLAIRLRGREHTTRHTFGLKRAEILAAGINSAALVLVSLYLFYESVQRLLHPAPVDGAWMAGIGAIGLVANVAGTVLLHKGAAHSLNVRSAYLHLLTDAASSLGVVIGGIVVTIWEVQWIDPVLTVLIGLYVLKEGIGILSEAMHILMEGSPPGFDVETLRERVESIPGVHDFHHVHVWTVGEGDVHIEAHVRVEDVLISEGDELRRAIESLARSSFGVDHVTLQLEHGQCSEAGMS